MGVFIAYPIVDTQSFSQHLGHPETGFYFIFIFAYVIFYEIQILGTIPYFAEQFVHTVYFPRILHYICWIDVFLSSLSPLHCQYLYCPI